MTLKMIANVLGEPLLIQKNLQLNYIGVNIYEENETLNPHILYLCFDNQIANQDLQNPSLGFILCMSDSIFMETSLCEWAVFTKKMTPLQLLTKIQAIFCEESYYNSNLSLLYETLISGGTVKDLIQISSKILRSPIILTNTAYKVIAMANDTNCYLQDPIWLYAQEYGYCSNQAIMQFKREGVTVKVHQTTDPLILSTGLAKEVPRILQQIQTDHKTVAYLGVFQCKEVFSDYHLRITKVLCSVLSVMFKKTDLSEDNTNIIYESLILDLIQKKLRGKTLINERLKASAWTVKPHLTILNIPLSNSDSSIHYVEYLRSTLLTNTKFSKAVRHRNRIVIVVNYTKEEDLQTDIKHIGNILKQNELSAGISESFDSLEHFNIYYTQANAACKLGKQQFRKNETIYAYPDFALLHLLSQIGNEVVINCIESPLYRTLKDYDLLQKTNYCETLYHYILCGNNITETAKKLFIHRNTMAYRLKKISELGNTNLTNGEELQRFFLTIKTQTLHLDIQFQ